METKICTKCGEEKELNNFRLNNFRLRKDSNSYRTDCKNCEKEYRKEYRKNNKDKIKDYNKEYGKEYGKDYREINKDKIKEYRKNNKPEIQEKKRIYNNDRRKKDSLFRLKSNLRSLIRQSLKAQNYTKKSKTHELLGADYETVHTHLILSAIRNYGYWLECEKYHIDHIIPCASATTEEELVKLQHYTNLQYLTPEDNLKKSDKLNWEL